MSLSPKQLMSVRESNGRVNVWDGSIRSGKTIGSLIRWLIYLADPPPGGELVMFGRTRDAVWRNVIGPLQDPAIFGGAAGHVVGNYGAPTVTILGRRVHVIGASDAKAEMTIRGMTVAGCYGDELTTVPEQFFTQMLGRMSVARAQLFGSTNPENPAHWLKRKFLDRIADLPDWRRFQFRLPDNPSLSPSYVEAISREFTGLWHRRFILGDWVAAEGAVYDGWDPDRHVIPIAALPAMQRMIAVGIDHGTTNPSAGILLGLSGGRLYACDEWWMDSAQMQAKPTVADQSRSLRTWLAERPTPEWVVLDPAAAAFRAQLFADGVTANNADNDVTYGISTVASLLGQGQLLVSDACTALIREFPGYSWDTRATELGQDKPIKVADHALDALRYSAVTTEASWRGLLAEPAMEAA